jgi:hypothetical protein
MGEPQIDLFANRSNKKLSMFCSLQVNPLEMTQDAFSIP